MPCLRRPGQYARFHLDSILFLHYLHLIPASLSIPSLVSRRAQAQKSFLRVARFEQEQWMRQEKQRWEAEMRTAKRQACGQRGMFTFSRDRQSY